MSLLIPVATAIIVVGITVFFTVYANNEPPSPTIPTEPHLAPYIGHAGSLRSSRRNDWLLDIAERLQSGIFSLHVNNGWKTVIIDGGLRKQVIGAEQRGDVVATPIQAQRLRYFFGDANVPQFALTASPRSPRSEEVLTPAQASSLLKSLSKSLETATATLISPTKSWVDQQPWERLSSCEPLPENTRPGTTVAVTTSSLPVLISAFVNTHILRALLGDTFVQNNEFFMNDFQSFTVVYESFMNPNPLVPRLFVPGLSGARYARENCLLALDIFVEELWKDAKVGEAGDEKKALWDGVGHEANAGIKEMLVDAKREGKKVKEVSSLLLAKIWEVIWGVGEAVTWSIASASEGQEEGFMQQLRQEMASERAVEVVPSEDTGLKFKEPTKVKVDMTKLHNGCPRLHSLVREILELTMIAEQEFETAKEIELVGLDAKTKKEVRYKLPSGQILRFAGPRYPGIAEAGAKAKTEKDAGVQEGQFMLDLVLLLSATILALHDFEPGDKSGTVLAGTAPEERQIGGVLCMPTTRRWSIYQR